MDDATTMGRFIRESRLRKGMSLGQLAARIGRSPSSVRRWERDEVAPAISVMPQLADVLDVDVVALERRRPVLHDPDAPMASDAREQKPSTIEQPVVPPSNGPLRTDALPGARRHLGLFGEMWNSVFAEKESWIGWVRGIGTAVILLLFFLVLIWAVGEFVDAISDVWHSFGTGS